MKVLITGATGLIGKTLVGLCHEEKIDVHYLTTSKDKIKNDSNYKGFYWNPTNGEIDEKAFDGVEAIINLVGASISKRWTKAYKKVILESRTQTANLIFNTLKNRDHTVKQFISASGISIYPNSKTRLYSEEDTDVDNTFLAEVVIAWEAAADQFKNLGIDVSKVRTGVVLSKNEGALPKLKQPVEAGFGAPLGSGKQWLSWIHLQDIACIYLQILMNEWEGTYNAVAPNPVTNKKMTKKIAYYLDKTLWLPDVPGFILKLILGEMAVLVLEGQLVTSKKLEKQGYTFQYYNIENALEDLL
ncbi:TIGR01777 family oxidoreductase [Cochleicola gelatinilyticus]|uniref:NAD-dependent epimerase n=1 Tax=Cochleicola gelatinilyticus TaxID=1763537 RepID=A0A167EQZ1_9FLAO|nr:TIGR01777 family oxidoreductase [Cochleicola gelatinilyticus]OAB75788.1 NAD-dependent epimerase [Cochleicola gelatinilyticus]